MKRLFTKNVFKAIAIGLVVLVCLVPASAAAGCAGGQTAVNKTVYINGTQSAACGALGAQNCGANINCAIPENADCTVYTVNPDCTQGAAGCTGAHEGNCVNNTQPPAPEVEAPVNESEAPAPEVEAPANKPETTAPEVEAPANETEAPKTEAPAAETEAPAAPASKVNDFEREVARLVNDIRRSNGLSELTLNEELSAVARVKAEDMAKNNYFSHTSPTYGSPFDMMKSFGISYRAAGENIAKGQTTPQQVVDAWMNSPGHRANILSDSFTQIGMGYTANGNHWCQMFIG